MTSSRSSAAPATGQPDCAATRPDADRRRLRQQLHRAAGNWQYKAALNHSWDESYGAHTRRRQHLARPAPAASVTFAYDHVTHWVADYRQRADRRPRPAASSRELGCSGDWQPDCLRSWLEDPDGDGVYTFETTRDPAGQLRDQGRDQRELGRELRRRAACPAARTSRSPSRAERSASSFSFDSRDARPDDPGRARRTTTTSSGTASATTRATRSTARRAARFRRARRSTLRFRTFHDDVTARHAARLQHAGRQRQQLDRR